MNKTALLALLTIVSSTTALAGGDPQAGQEKAKVCAACNGADGNSTIAANPRLAGQYATYIHHALTQYKNGERKNPIMSGMVANLTDQDMKDLAAWFSSQTGDTLHVLPHEQKR